MMHYDPSDAGKPVEDVYPLYLNAEWYLMKIHVLGRDTEEVCQETTLFVCVSASSHSRPRLSPSSLRPPPPRHR